MMQALAPKPAGGRTLIVSEEGLLNETGHWFEYCKSVVELNQAQGVSCLVAGHAEATASVRQTIPFRAIYPSTSWGTINTEPNPLKRHALTARHNLTVARAMSGLIAETGPVDLVFAPTVTIQHILGWRMFASRHLGKTVGRLVLLIRNSVASYQDGSDVPHFKSSAQLLAASLRSFRRYERDGGFTFATDSERLADEYEALSSMRPVVFPSPRTAPLTGAVPASAKAGGAVVFSSLGPARFEKGIDVFQNAIGQLLARGEVPKARFVIQWNMPFHDASGHLVVPEPALVADDRVRVLTQDLSSEEYNSELFASDCIVLPYRRESYFARISGIAVEAATAGIPMIYTRGTWCEDLVRSSGAGIGIPDGDADALAEAIVEIAAHIDQYKAQAATAALRARRLHSAESFNSLLWGNVSAG